MIRMLAVMPESANYNSFWEVAVARSFSEAKAMIEQAERAGAPFDDLDLPVRKKSAFWEFIDWMEARERRYPFSVFGCRNTRHFIRIRDEARRRGLVFED